MILHELGVFPAPCKVNLTLDVFAPRADGYHALDSIVARFSPHDDLEILCAMTPDGTVNLSCDDPDLPTDGRNLAHKAATLFQTQFKTDGWQIGIHLTKRLPHQAGLGGGSSDAATVLRALYDSYNDYAPVSQDALHRLAARIGSDVLLFLLPGFVRIEGRGDIAATIPTPQIVLHGVIVKPKIGVSTPVAFRLLDAIPDRKPGQATQNLLTVLQSSPNDLAAIASALGNDFELAILPAFPEVEDAYCAVRGVGALRALLCGSGSSVFGLAESAAHAESLANDLRAMDRFAWVEVAESLP